MYVNKKIVIGVMLAEVMIVGCERKTRTKTVTDPKQTEEINQLTAERDELAKKLQLATDPKVAEKIEQLQYDLAAREAQIKEKDAQIAAKDKELEEAKKGSDLEQVSRLQKELDSLKGEKVKMEAEYKAALDGKQALIDAAERDRVRFEKVLEFSFQKNIQNRSELDGALNEAVAEIEGRVVVLTNERAELKASIASGYERIITLQQRYVHPVEDMLADKNALEAIKDRSQEQEEKLEILIDYFTASEHVDAQTKMRLTLATDRDKLEQERDTLATQLAAVVQEEALILDEIVKLSETEGSQPTEKMQALISHRNFKLAQIAYIRTKKAVNDTALEQNARDTDVTDRDIKEQKQVMDSAYDWYQKDTVAPSREELKLAEAAQTALLEAYKENGKDLEKAKDDFAEIKDLRDFMAARKLTEPLKEPKAD